MSKFNFHFITKRPVLKRGKLSKSCFSTSVLSVTRYTTWSLKESCSIAKGMNQICICLYICKTDCLYLCMHLCPSFKCKPPDQSPPNFAQTSTPTQGRFLTQVWPCQPDPWPWHTPNSKTYKQITGEKTLLNKKCIKFFPAPVG